tara:strand:+ start:409 stop:654 length:246 start_codon:yes stop_codon:yes gene_type:complete
LDFGLFGAKNSPNLRGLIFVTFETIKKTHFEKSQICDFMLSKTKIEKYSKKKDQPISSQKTNISLLKLKIQKPSKNAKKRV